MTASPLKPPVSRPRFEAIDALRGIALGAMFVFHITWDLAYFRLIPPAFPYSPPFKAFGHTIAGTFFFLVGVSLVLASRGGLNRRAFTRRFIEIVAAAAAITAVTSYLFTDSFIFFGILHCIALASLVALPFLRAPLSLVALVAAAALVGPVAFSSPYFNEPMWWWLGLGTVEPTSNDWRPFLPWFGVVLGGEFAARLMLTRGLPVWLADWRARNSASRTLVWGGQHSLLVYLVHQPVFFAIIYMVARAIGPVPDVAAAVDDQPFVSSCVQQCTATGPDQQTCQQVCSCIAGEIRTKPQTWNRLVRDAITPADQDMIQGFTQICVQRHVK